MSRDVAKDPAETALIAKHKDLVRPIASKVIGHITTDVTAAGNAAGDSQLGDLIADAQLADPSTVTGGQTPVIAFMNPGGIRADLTYASSPYAEPPGDVTFEEAFTVQPFNNYLVSMTLTGQDIYDLLAQQLPRTGVPSRRILQVSKGFSYQLGPAGAVDGTVTLDGTPIDKAASYRIVTNNFLSDGGDSFPAFTHGTGKYFGGLDIDAFASYLPTVSPYTPGPLTRITQWSRVRTDGSGAPPSLPFDGRPAVFFSARDTPSRRGWDRTHVRTTVVSTRPGSNRRRAQGRQRPS